MRKILASLLVIGLTIVLIGGATLAAFYDTETSDGNTFTASTLDLLVDGINDPLPVKFTIISIAPSSNGTVNWTLKNNGKTDGFIDLEDVTVVNDPGATTEPEAIYNPDLGELGANMNIVVTIGATTIYTGTLDGFDGFSGGNVPLGDGEEIDVTINWVVPSGVGNIIQGDVANVGITFELAQTTGQ